MIVLSQIYPRRFALAVVWCGVVLPVPFLLFVYRPEWIGSLPFVRAYAVTLAAGVASITPIAVLRLFDHKRADMTNEGDGEGGEP